MRSVTCSEDSRMNVEEKNKLEFESNNHLPPNMKEFIINQLNYSFIDNYVDINFGSIKVTGAHPFFAWDDITETYQFTRAEDLVEGDKIVKYNSETSLVEDILIEKIESYFY